MTATSTKKPRAPRKPKAPKLTPEQKEQRRWQKAADRELARAMKKYPLLVSAGLVTLPTPEEKRAKHEAFLAQRELDMAKRERVEVAAVAEARAAFVAIASPEQLAAQPLGCQPFHVPGSAGTPNAVRRPGTSQRRNARQPGATTGRAEVRPMSSAARYCGGRCGSPIGCCRASRWASYLSRNAWPLAIADVACSSRRRPRLPPARDRHHGHLLSVFIRALAKINLHRSPRLVEHPSMALVAPPPWPLRAPSPWRCARLRRPQPAPP
jgi:hypothetical protein